MLAGRILRVSAAATLLVAATAMSAQAGAAAGPKWGPAPIYGAPGAGDSYYPEAGNGGYQVDHYDVSLSYDPVSHQLQGTTRITATATAALKGFNLDLLGYTVDSVRVNASNSSFSRQSVHELVIRQSAVLGKGQRFTVEVRYHGIPDPSGAWIYSPSGGAFAVGEPEAASSWFPVNETTRDKATFAVHATVPTGWDVVSNGIASASTSAHGQTTFNWRENTPITGYLTTIVIDHLSYLKQQRSNGMPLLSAFAPGTGANVAAEKQLPAILDFEESLFGRYPIDTGGGVYESGPYTAALETQGRSLYMIEQGSAAVASARNIAHENAHQWWGDSVSLQNWSDICLNECIAAYAEDLWSAHADGLDLDNQYRNTVQANLGNPEFWDGVLRNGGPDSAMFNVVYTRGPLFMQALRHQVGDRAFFRTLKTFPALHRNSTATLDQFIELMQGYSQQDLTAFVHAWLDSTTVPAAQYLWPGTLHP